MGTAKPKDPRTQIVLSLRALRPLKIPYHPHHNPDSHRKGGMTDGGVPGWSWSGTLEQSAIGTRLQGPDTAQMSP